MPPSRLIATTRQVRDVERISWSSFRLRYFNPQTFGQGEHVSIIGTTGQGKTLLAMRGILPVREAQAGYIVILDVKTDDANVQREGYIKIDSWPPRRIGPPGRRERHFFRLAPSGKKRESMPRQKRIMRSALRSIYDEGHWTVYMDEAQILTWREHMGLVADARALWVASRSKHVTMIASTQAPKFVPSEMFSQPTHLFLFAVADEEQAQRLSEIGGDTHTIREINRQLEENEFLYVHTRKRIYVRSALDLGQGGS